MFKKLFSSFAVFGITMSLGLNLASAATTPPLTYLQVASVESELGGYEDLTENQVSTVKDHGGSFMYVTTIQLGYSSSKFARMAGNVLPLLKSTPLDINGDFVIDGYQYTWNASGSQYSSGTFSYEATSSSSPFNKMSDSINIR